MVVYFDYFISFFRINGSVIELIFSVLKFIVGGNFFVSNYGFFCGRVIIGWEVIINSNLECGYCDDVILVFGLFILSDGGLRMLYLVWLVFDFFGLSEIK